ncbi:MAG: hypothetical protein VW548_06105, partial [Methylotenera sp.]
MNALTQILATTDLSAPARHAVDRGFQIAAQHQAQYGVVHAIELDLVDSLREWIGNDVAAVKAKLEQDAASALQEQLAHCKEQHKT